MGYREGHHPDSYMTAPQIHTASSGEGPQTLWIGADDPPTTSGDDSWTLLAAGDFCPLNARPDASLVSEPLRRRIQEAKLALVNFEGPIARGEAPHNRIPLTLRPEAPDWAAQIGFNVLGLANNHIADGGLDGIRATLSAIDAAGLQRAGAGESVADAFKPARVEVSPGLCASIVCVCDTFSGVATPTRPGFGSMHDPKVFATIRDANERGDVVVVYVHAGIEDVPLPPPQLRDAMRALVRHGANLVLGAHPHVPQTVEMYEGAIVAYSLGNVLFDSVTGASQPQRNVSYVLEAVFNGPRLLGCHLVPVEQHESVVRLMDETERRDPEALLNHLKRLHEIQQDERRYHACWQETAIRVFQSHYMNDFAALEDVRGGLAAGRLTRAHQSRRLLRQLAYLWMPDGVRKQLRAIRKRLRGQTGPAPDGTAPFQQLSPDSASIPPELRRILGSALARIRIAADRWTIETALAVLSGEEPDLRDANSRAETDAILSFANPISPAPSPQPTRVAESAD